MNSGNIDKFTKLLIERDRLQINEARNYDLTGKLDTERILKITGLTTELLTMYLEGCNGKWQK